MSIESFNRNQLMQIFDMGVSINCMMYIPFELIHRDKVGEHLEDFINDLSDRDNNTFKQLAKNLPELKELVKDLQNGDYPECVWATDFMPELYKAIEDHQFLIQIEIPVPKKFQFKDGRAVSWSYGGVYRMEWILAKDMQHAFNLIVEKYAEVRSEAIKVELNKQKGKKK